MRARPALLLLLALALLAARPAPRNKRRPPRPRPAAVAMARAELLWPLEFDDGLAAAFGELRGDRLHTGIDLRTRGEAGHATRAVADGEVVRLKEEWRGYGLALYLSLPGGRIAVYGHLNRVAPDLEARLAAARAARGSRWAGDVEIAPGRPARRGETIAWAGESGAGLPHLHFEIREGMDRPIDPFGAGLAAPGDDLAPSAERLIVVPAGPASLLEGDGGARRHPLRATPGGYRSPEPIPVCGPVHLLLEAYDRAGAQSKTGLGGLRTWLDGEEVYRLRFDQIPFGQNHAAGAVLDLARSHLGPTFYAYRLTGLAGAELPFARPGRGPLTLAPGRHRLEVELEDAVTTVAPRARVTIELEATAAAPAPPPLPPPPAGTVLRSLSPSAAGELALDGFRLSVPAAATWATIEVAARTLEPPPSLPEGLVLLAPAVLLTPDGHPFRAPVRVDFTGAASGPRTGVYRLDPVDGSWGLLDLGHGADVRRLGTYALLEDRAAPVIDSITIEGRRIVVKVRDLGSGIPERGVMIDIDGSRLDELYDPDRGRVTARLPDLPGPSTARVVRVRASDRAGNLSERQERRSLR